MGVIIQFILITGIIIFWVVRQAAKKQVEESPKALPPIPKESDLRQWYDNEDVAKVIPEDLHPHHKTSKPVLHPEKSGNNKKQPSLTSTRNKPENEPEILFNSTEDAKRAFIYSEIFNRKY